MQPLHRAVLSQEAQAHLILPVLSVLLGSSSEPGSYCSCHLLSAPSPTACPPSPLFPVGQPQCHFFFNKSHQSYNGSLLKCHHCLMIKARLGWKWVSALSPRFFPIFCSFCCTGPLRLLTAPGMFSVHGFCTSCLCLSRYPADMNMAYVIVNLGSQLGDMALSGLESTFPRRVNRGGKIFPRVGSIHWEIPRI